MTNIVEKALAQETAEERAHEENENIQGFSPVNPGLVTPGNTGGASSLIPNSLLQSGAPLLGKPSAPITIVEFGDFNVNSVIDSPNKLNQKLTHLTFKLVRLT